MVNSAQLMVNVIIEHPKRIKSIVSFSFKRIILIKNAKKIKLIYLHLQKKVLFGALLKIFSKHGIHFIIGIILARLLTPEDYGLIGMCAIFIAIGNSFCGQWFWL